VVVQPVPQLDVHVFFDWQSYVAPLGGAAASLAAASPASEIAPAPA
jgi:hypothetical protein